MKVTRNPNLRLIHPEIVKGQTKYAPKYDACRPLDLLAVMFSVVWKCEFSTSSSPYAKPQRKNKIVTAVVSKVTNALCLKYLGH